MLNKIIKELKDVETMANKIKEDAKNEAQKMMRDERIKLEKLKQDEIDQSHKNGNKLVEERIAKAQQISEEIYKKCNEDKHNIKSILKGKREEAIKMILDDLVKENGSITNQ